MKNNKFLVKTFNEDGSEKTETQYKSFREISNAYNITYHDAREINKICNGNIKKKYTHGNITNLLTKIKIYNIEPVYKI